MRTCKDCGQTLPDRVFAAIKGTRWRHTRYNRCRNIRQRERRKAAVLPSTVNQVFGAVAEVTGIDAALILRPDPVLDARIVAAHLLRYPAGLSTKEITTCSDWVRAAWRSGPQLEPAAQI